MEITIKKLTMRNFKGVLGERVVEFNPTVTKVYGANRTGKTTIADAFRWCLFGKNSEGKQDFGIKTKDAQGNVIPDLSHEVCVELVVDGSSVTLARVYTEKWNKPRGQAEKKLTGHTTAFYVDGQLYTEGDYNSYIKSLCDESLFMTITSPTYFVGLKADKQRSMLTEMVGEVSTASVAKGNPQFEALLQAMGDQEVEKYRQHLSYQMKEVKEQLGRIPVRINEQRSEIAKITPENVNWEQVDGDLKATDDALQRIADEIGAAVADSSKAQEAEQAKLNEHRKALRADIAKAQDKLEAVRMKHVQAYNADNSQRSEQVMHWNNEVRTAERELQITQEQLGAASTRIQQAQQLLQTLQAEKQAFVERWNALDAEVLVFNADQFICPTCKRPLEAEDIASKKAEMQANFNADKARRMDAMEAEANGIKQRTTNADKALQQAQAEKDKLLGELPAREQAVNAAREGYTTAQAMQVQALETRLEADGEFTSLKNTTIPQLTAQLDKMPTQAAGTTSVQEVVASLQADQQQLQGKRDQLKALVQVRETIANKNKRIAELDKQEQELNIQLTQLEGQDYTAEQLVQRTIEELETKVNALFKFVRFTMFDHRINGALKPICECTVGGVPYSDLNNADRINAGIDIINAMCSDKGVYAPCFIDNAESINEVLPMQSQRIDLIVSTDTELKIVNN